mgnify:FL=1
MIMRRPTRRIMSKKLSCQISLNAIDWPPYSSDLNPIENLRALLKADILKRAPDSDISKCSTKTHHIIYTYFHFSPLAILQDLPRPISRRTTRCCPIAPRLLSFWMYLNFCPRGWLYCNTVINDISTGSGRLNRPFV